MKAPLQYLSVCSGIEAASVAWQPLGWRPVAFSEIDAFPSAVLAHHHPNVPNWGDMTRFKEWPDAAIDLLVGGTPCQSFSLAGFRKGLDDPRGNLALVYLGLVDRYRPKWVVWENVPGVLSSSGGRDFGAFLGGLGELGYGWAYRVLDAQYIRTRRFSGAVPQRRRRVFVVGYLGDWRPAAAVLFEPESLRGHPPARREPGQGATHDVAGSLVSSGRGVDRCGETRGQDPVVRVIREGFGGGNTSGPIDVAACLTAKGQRIDFEVETFVAQTLRGEGFDASEDGTGRQNLLPVAFDSKGSQVQIGDPGATPTLRAMGHAGSHANAGGQLAVAFDLRGREGGAMPEGPHETANIRAASGGSSRSYIATSWGVRRLTTRECARLQAFPDDYSELIYADADEAHAAQILHVLWREAGTQAVEREGWRIGKSASLLSPQILLAGVHSGWLSWSLARRCATARGALPGEDHCQEGLLQRLRVCEDLGRSPYRRESFEQLAAEFGCSVQELPLEAAQARAALRRSGLWTQAQKEWPLRYAFAAPEKRHRLDRLNPDGPRYKALGNSMAVNAMDWLGQRIEYVRAILAEQSP